MIWLMKKQDKTGTFATLRNPFLNYLFEFRIL
jgi:hypothetical protein